MKFFKNHWRGIVSALLIIAGCVWGLLVGVPL